MITRYIASAVTGLLVTLGLLFLMHALIEVSQAVESTPTEIDLTFGYVTNDTEAETIVDTSPEFTPPPDLPPLQPPIDPVSTGTPTGITHFPEAPDDIPLGPPTLQGTDNSLINIMHVETALSGVSTSQRAGRLCGGPVRCVRIRCGAKR